MGGLGVTSQVVWGFPESLEPFQLGKFPPGWLASAVGSSCSWCRGRCGTKCRPRLVVGWGIYPWSMGFFGETSGEALETIWDVFKLKNSCLQVNWETSCVAFFFCQVECCVKSVSSGGYSGYRWWEAICEQYKILKTATLEVFMPSKWCMK